MAGCGFELQFIDFDKFFAEIISHPDIASKLKNFIKNKTRNIKTIFEIGNSNIVVEFFTKIGVQDKDTGVEII